MSSFAAKSVVSIVARRLCTSAVRSNASAAEKGVIPNASSYKTMQHLQSEWINSGDKLVWQKRGLDKLMYAATIGTMLAGTCAGVYYIIVMSFPALQVGRKK